jgi:predicted adenine nucleotide alpha hydrolase (AANH) superfamily ATPase
MRRRLTLHICCAPDATTPWPALAEEYDVIGFFYGSNIHPLDEWLKRRDAVGKLSAILGAEAEIASYEPDLWLSEVGELASMPEGGARCEVCFRLQLEAAASFAVSNGCGYLCTTLSISPHKDPELINRVGMIVSDIAGIEWVYRVWRKNDGFKLSVNRSREMGLYRQNYCGCVYSAARFADAAR